MPATACTSSRITVSTPASASRAAEVSIRNSDSGVVIRMSGGRVVERPPLGGRGVAGADADPDLRLGQPQAHRLLADARSAGTRRLRSTSTARALSGDTYRTRQRFFASAGAGVAASRSSAARNAASVLPEPVGATTRTSEPSAIARQAPSCAAVGAVKAPVNQPRVAGEKESSAVLAMVPIVHPPTDNGPDLRE